MIADRYKVQIAMARACMSVQDISEIAKMPVPTVNNVISGRRSVKPETIGRVAKILQVDVTEILADIDNES